ncbi:unnamed protein product [Paramecium primaurelia]|uniref:RING-type domain-containing protein n=1 Tax=Paramecium primaurelia TaxID=5886 RepID=A0A8S1Q7K0_PARPR|nr:unnamed protein product [Paramecium primaurelia]
MDIQKIISDTIMETPKDEILKQFNERNIQVATIIKEKLLKWNSSQLINFEINTLEICFGVFFQQIIKQSQNQQIRNQFGIFMNQNQQLKDINQQKYIELCRKVFNKSLISLSPLNLDFKTIDDQLQESFIGEIYISGKQSQYYQSDKFSKKEPIKYYIFLFQSLQVNGTKLHLIFSTNKDPQFPQQQFQQQNQLPFQQQFNQNIQGNIFPKKFQQPQNQGLNQGQNQGQNQIQLARLLSFPIQQPNNSQFNIRSTQLNNNEQQNKNQNQPTFNNVNNQQFQNINQQFQPLNQNNIINNNEQQQKNSNQPTFNNFNNQQFQNINQQFQQPNQNNIINNKQNNNIFKNNAQNCQIQNYPQNQSIIMNNNNGNQFNFNNNNNQFQQKPNNNIGNNYQNNEIKNNVPTNLFNNNHQFNNPQLQFQNNAQNNIIQPSPITVQQPNFAANPILPQICNEPNIFSTVQMNTKQEDEQQEKKVNDFSRLQTKINTKIEDNSTECDICYEKYYLNPDEVIITPCCKKKVHLQCTQDNLNNKAKENMNFKKIVCHVCEQSLKQYQDYLKSNISIGLYVKIIKCEITANIPSICCKCSSPIQASLESKQVEIECLKCNTKLCSLCYQEYHGEIQTNQKCPSLLTEIQKAIADMPILVCPFCNLMQTKDDKCNHVTCYGCKIDLCSACSVERFPILQHGNHYHRVGCPDYAPLINNGKVVTEPEFLRRKCKRCLETNQPCQYPISLEEYKKEKQF